MKAVAALGFVLLAACSSSGSGTVGDSSSGCFAGPSGNICQVSNGATVLPDGGVSGGTETCQSICGAGDYEMTCKCDPKLTTHCEIPTPDPSLGCKIIPLPTPQDVLDYCCPYSP